MKCNSLLALIVSTLLSGCVPYPIYKTLQPSAKVTVVDHLGKPVSNATVTLIANTYPYGRERSRDTQTTTDEGLAAFSPRREWRTEVLAIHGSQEFYWNWCVQKEGFETLSTTYGGASQFQSEFTATLKPGPSKPCRASIR
jgi:hypothetical protein